MRRIIAMAVITAALVVATPVSAHEGDPLYGGCMDRGGQLAAAMWGREGHEADRNGDGVICFYIKKNGSWSFADNHSH